MWWKTIDGGYVNAANVARLSVGEVTGVWRVRADGNSLAGDYASEEEAQSAARILCQGVDPATITSGA